MRVLDLVLVQAPDFRPAPRRFQKLAGNSPQRVALHHRVTAGRIRLHLNGAGSQASRCCLRERQTGDQASRSGAQRSNATAGCRSRDEDCMWFVNIPYPGEWVGRGKKQRRCHMLSHPAVSAGCFGAYGLH